MHKKAIIALVLILIALALPSFSEEIKSNQLNLDEAINLAVKKEMGVHQKQIDLSIAKENINYAKRFKNPSLETEFLTGNTSLGNPQQVGMSIPVEILKRGARKNVAVSEQKEAQYDLDTAIFNLKINIRKSYISFAAQKTLARIVKKQKALFQENADSIYENLQKGKAENVEYLQAKLFSDQMEIHYNEALKNIEIEKIKFNQILNLEEDGPLYDIKTNGLLGYNDFIELKTISPKQELLSMNKIEEIALNNRTDIKNAQQEIITAQKKFILTTRQKIPDVTFIWAYQFLTPFQNNDFSISDGGYLQGVMMGGTIELPVLYRHKPEIQKAKLEIDKKIIEYNEVKKQALKNVDIAYLEFITAKKNLNCYQEILLLDLDEILEKTEENYMKGSFDISDLILVQQNQLKIMNSYVDALEKYYLCWIELVNQASSEDLVKINP